MTDIVYWCNNKANVGRVKGVKRYVVENKGIVAGGVHPDEDQDLCPGGHPGYGAFSRDQCSDHRVWTGQL